jgi:hypothetical protein
MSNTVTCVYVANCYNETPASAAAAIGVAAVPLDPTLIAFLGVTVNSDVTAPGVLKATRTIVLNLTAAFKAIFPDTADQRGPFWNFMTGLIQASALTPVVAAAPVLA